MDKNLNNLINIINVNNYNTFTFRHFKFHTSYKQTLDNKL